MRVDAINCRNHHASSRQSERDRQYKMRHSRNRTSNRLDPEKTSNRETSQKSKARDEPTQESSRQECGKKREVPNRTRQASMQRLTTDNRQRIKENCQTNSLEQI